MEIRTSTMATPLGDLTLTTTPVGLCGLAFDNRLERLWAFLERRFGSLERRPHVGTAPSRTYLEAYFNGTIEALTRIKTDAGGSKYQRRVWSALCEIPGGSTVSYGELATSIGQPTGSRAVATANAINPVAIAIPCHRVIHADGSISGYGGGVERKRWLLRHESEHLPFRLAPGGAC